MKHSLADGASKQVRVSTSCAMELWAAEGGVAAREGSSRNRIPKGEGNTGGAEKEQVIRWERFLPQKFLRVLLVENDDSTRHIVAALLRKCCYHVAAVADGLKAWEVLKEKNYNFDLILTEVVMPSLSGVGLLSKIMSNDLCKNIPVIMMSSHDSIGVVFKCMLKGAADFLVKPVRKNELRNLWQHVWRKYCSNHFGDGSHSQNTNQRTFEAESENEAASKNGSSNADNRTKTRDSSDKESETQNSCCKPDTEIESNWMQVEPPETNCRNVSKETGSKLGDDHDKAKLAASSIVNEKGKSEAKSAGIEIEVTVSVQDSVSTKKNGGKNGFYDGSTVREENRTAAKSKDISPESVDQIEETNRTLKEIIEFIGAATSKQCNYPVLKNNNYREDILGETASSSDVGKKICESGSSPTLWELSLRGPQGWSEGAFHKKHVLNHSDSSAFSRYRNSRIHVSHPRSESSAAGVCLKTGHSGEVNCSMHSDIDNGKVTMLPHMTIMISSNGDGNENPIYSQLSCGIENADTPASGAVIKNACLSNLFNLKPVLPHPQHGFVSLPNPVGIIPSRSLYAGYDAMLNPIFSQEPPTSIGSSSKETGFHSLNPYVDKYNDLANNILCDKFQCSAENHQHLQLRMGMSERTDVQHEDLQLMMHTPRDTANQHFNVNFGITGITDANGSNGINEDTSAAFNNGAALESGNEDGFQGCNSKGLDCDHSQRDAALTRFRLKRKDRCFEKKVRYHSRKKLAEQRPRLKGQFVRQ